MKKHILMSASYTKNKGSNKSFLKTYRGKTTLVTKSRLIKELNTLIDFPSPVTKLKAYSNGILIVFLSKGGIRFLGQRVA